MNSYRYFAVSDIEKIILAYKGRFNDIYAILYRN